MRKTIIQIWDRNHKPLRQGDTLFVPVVAGALEALKASNEVKRDEHGRFVFAEGEVSGHAHAIRETDSTAFSFDTAEAEALLGGVHAMIDAVRVGGSGAVLNHEYASGQMADHFPHSLAPGVDYICFQQSETRRGEVVRAAD